MGRGTGAPFANTTKGFAMTLRAELERRWKSEWTGERYKAAKTMHTHMLDTFDKIAQWQRDVAADANLSALGKRHKMRSHIEADLASAFEFVRSGIERMKQNITGGRAKLVPTVDKTDM